MQTIYYGLMQLDSVLLINKQQITFFFHMYINAYAHTRINTIVKHLELKNNTIVVQQLTKSMNRPIRIKIQGILRFHQFPLFALPFHFVLNKVTQVNFYFFFVYVSLGKKNTFPVMVNVKRLQLSIQYFNSNSPIVFLCRNSKFKCVRLHARFHSTFTHLRAGNVRKSKIDLDLMNTHIVHTSMCCLK